VPLAASAAAWGVLFAAVPPGAQDFPLGDDWAFARGAFAFARGGGVRYSGWASMPQLGQWLWSLPFVGALGESHAALRLSTLAASWVGLAAFYDLLRGQGFSPARAAFCATALALNPLFVLSQGTYMTDVPALSFALAALALYARAVRGADRRWLAAATATALLGAVTRQNTLAAPVAAGILLARSPGLRGRPAWWLAVALPVAAGVATHAWFQRRPDVVALSPHFPDAEYLLLLPFLALHLCGLAALPVLLLGPRPGSWKVFALCLAAVAACAAAWAGRGDTLPYGGLFPFCTGMLSPEGAYTPGLVVGERDVLLTAGVRLALTALGCVGGAALLARLAGRPRAGAPGLLLPFTLVQVVLLLIARAVYDRYLEFLLPGALALAGAGAGRLAWRGVPAAAALALYGAVSVGLMHDWLAWNAARWALGRRAVAAGVRPADIEGGFEWDGWFAPDPAPPAADDAGLALPFTRDYFPWVTGRYALAFSVPPGAVAVDAELYTTWLPPARRVFYLARPAGAGDAAPPGGPPPAPGAGGPRL
jgi:hypothetical protein